jgi:hypothetical protein
LERTGADTAIIREAFAMMRILAPQSSQCAYPALETAAVHGGMVGRRSDWVKPVTLASACAR